MAQISSRPTVASGLITAGDVRVEYMQSVLNALVNGSLTRAERSIDNWLVQPSGPYLDIGRNHLARKFLDGVKGVDREYVPTEDYFLSTDGDIQFAPEHVDMLVEVAEQHRRDHGVYPVVSGAYRGFYQGQHITIAYRMVDVDGDTQLQAVSNEEVSANDDPVPITAAGAGFLLIHRSILEHIRDAYKAQFPQEIFAEVLIPASPLSTTETGTWFGEDLVFCFRAANLGHPILLHRGVKLTHFKTIGLAYDPPQPESPSEEE